MNNDSKRIAKNTLYLYIRMTILMGVTLFTSRVVLDKLGIEDFGVYNVVGGVAVLFTFFSSSLTNASQRFLTIELGHHDLQKANIVFNQHLIFYTIIVGGVLILAETVGLWLVYHKLVIPPERLYAAVFVYQFTIASLCLTLLGIVFKSSIIAHENMNVFSFLGIFEGISRLAIVYMLSIADVDRLILYGFLMFAVTLMLQVFYMCYCFRHYVECKLRWVWDKALLKDTNAIVGWNIVGTVVHAINDSGVNILLNLFFGPAVNAARAVSFQISGAISNLAINFFTSVRPQITKSYVIGDYAYVMTLFYNSSKYSFFLMWMLCLPIAFACNELLGFWLVEVPPYTSMFALWTLAYSLMASLDNPVWTIALATGKLKSYMTIGGGTLLLIFPLSYIALQCGSSPVSVFIIMVMVRLVYLLVVLYIIKAYIPLIPADYMAKVVYPIAKVMAISLLVATILHYAMPVSVLFTLLYCAITVVVTVVCIWVVGISKCERVFVKNLFEKMLNRK